MMHIWPCTRRGFVDFLASQKPLSVNEVRSVSSFDGISISGDNIMLVWQESPVNVFALPHAAIVSEDGLTDFLAWVSTYFRQFRPFTAHCRVLTPSLAHSLSQSIPSSSFPEIRSADLGLILAEGIAYTVGRTDPSRLPFSAYSRTLSFAFAECARQYDQIIIEKGTAFDQIKSGWLLARELSNQTPLDLSASIIRDVWSVVLRAAAGNDTNKASAIAEPILVEALKGVRTNGKLSKNTWTKLSDCFQNSESLSEAMEGSREGRVKAADIAIRELAHGPESTRRHRAFIAGYIASRIQPGTLDHFTVLTPAVANLRESYLWYGACSGLTPETSVDNYGNGLGWLMKRELERPSQWMDRPDCDIALSEMDLLLRNREGMKVSLRTLVSGLLKVEIFPLISTSVKWTEHGENYISERSAQAEPQRSLFSEDTQLLRQDVLELLRKVEESSMSLNAIRKQVETKFGEKIPKDRNRRK